MLTPDIEKRIKRVVSVVVSQLVLTLTKYLILGFIMVSVLGYFTVGYDSTDGEKRSGMSLSTDALTGCQYLGSPYGGLTPRLNQDGTHICEGG